MIKDLNRISTDKLRRDIILPKKIVWCSDGVRNAENLLRNTEQQAPTNDDNVTIFSSENGKKAAILLDFGCEFTGGVQIVARGSSIPNGGRFKIRFGESVSEALATVGEKGYCIDHSRLDMDIVLPDNSCSRYGMTGYRFLYMELTEPDCYFLVISVQGVFTYRDIPYLGSFECNDSLLNQIYDTCAYTVHLNIQENVWDGIKRDRMVWIGDLHPEMLTIRTVFGYVDAIDDCLRMVSNREFLTPWPNDMTSYGLWYILILWDWYLHNGRRELLEELKEYWTALLSSILVLVHEGDEEILHEEEFEKGFFLDWPSRYLPDAKAGVYGLCSLALSAGEQLCNTVGETLLAEECHQKLAVMNKYQTDVCEKKQSIAMMQLAGRIADETAAELLSAGGGDGMSTFMGVYILKAAKNVCGSSVALDMLREYYGGMLSVGATTFWEDFDLAWLQEGVSIERLLEDGEYDIHGDNGRFCYQGFRHSLCHGWSGGPAAFLAEDILGIEILEPGCRKLAIHPDLGNLTWAKGTYPTPYGIVRVFAEKKDGNIIVDVDAPEEIEIVREG